MTPRSSAVREARMDVQNEATSPLGSGTRQTGRIADAAGLERPG